MASSIRQERLKRGALSLAPPLILPLIVSQERDYSLCVSQTPEDISEDNSKHKHPLVFLLCILFFTSKVRALPFFNVTIDKLHGWASQMTYPAYTIILL